MTTIYFLRHGHVENHNGLLYGREFNLSEEGRQQIRDRVEEMKREGVAFREIVVSPFNRTVQTAEIVANAYGMTFTTDDRLREWDVGPWFDKPLDEFYAATHYDETPPKMNDPRIEPLSEMAKRVMQVVNELRERVIGGAGLIISHREPIVSALLTIQGRSLDEIHELQLEPSQMWSVVYADDGTVKEVSFFSKSR